MNINIESRYQLGELLNSLGLIGKGVEVGVFEGNFSNHLLSTWSGKKLYLVDVWRGLDNYDDSSNQKNLYTALHCITSTFKKVHEFKERAVLIREESVLSSHMFQDGSLDFVYIDAGHDYTSVKKDLEAWYPKVKRGGIFSGHDYFDGYLNMENAYGLFEVKKAVDEFSKSIEKELVVTTKDGDFPSWLLQV